MINDLALASSSPLKFNADVLVIGGGIAGLITATRLSKLRKRVIVAESGGMTQEESTHPLNAVEQVGDVYGGAQAGRFRCLGGTSTRWGGAMLPFQATDFESFGDELSPHWPLSLAAFTDYLSTVEDLFRLGNGSYDFPDKASGRFLARFAKWPAFHLRNVATALQSEIRRKDGPEVWLNATATDFSVRPENRLSAVTLRSLNGKSMVIQAKEFVLAAGAIESTRLLLLADRQHDDQLFAPDDVLGRYFHDHLSASIATITPTRGSQKHLNRAIGFGFEGRVMRNLRFEPSAALRRESGVAPGFVHIGFSTQKPGGFDALRDVLRSAQRRSSPTLGETMALLRTLPWLARAVWWRYVERRLLFPDGADFHVHAVVEQSPWAENRIGLSAKHVDPFGKPIATICWKVQDRDAERVALLAEEFLTEWKTGPLCALASIELKSPSPEELRTALADGGGVFHPGGSARMAALPSQGVVDSHLRCFRVPNLSVISTATFPTGGGANPTMMLMMAAMRASDRISSQL